jgi:uncharacterized protein
MKPTLDGHPTLITPKLVKLLREKFALDWTGIHGASHWSRVRLNGKILSNINGADFAVIEYFAFLHDSCRQNDGKDPKHGSRAAEFAKSNLRNEIILNDDQFEILTSAMEGHTGGFEHDNLTVETCWDSDRLDLGRVGKYPDPIFLCTKAARNTEIINAAWDRSRGENRK